MGEQASMGVARINNMMNTVRGLDPTTREACTEGQRMMIGQRYRLLNYQGGIQCSRQKLLLTDLTIADIETVGHIQDVLVRVLDHAHVRARIRARVEGGENAWG